MPNNDTQSEIRSKRRADIFRQLEQNVLEAAPDIVEALIQQARNGSCQHAKFLFDLVDASPAKKQETDDDDIPGPSLAEILLERLQIIEEEDERLSAESAGHA